MDQLNIFVKMNKKNKMKSLSIVLTYIYIYLSAFIYCEDKGAEKYIIGNWTAVGINCDYEGNCKHTLNPITDGLIQYKFYESGNVFRRLKSKESRGFYTIAGNELRIEFNKQKEFFYIVKIGDGNMLIKEGKSIIKYKRIKWMKL